MRDEQISFTEIFLLIVCVSLIAITVYERFYVNSTSYKSRIAIHELCPDSKFTQSKSKEFLQWLGNEKVADPEFFRAKCAEFEKERKNEMAKMLSDM